MDEVKALEIFEKLNGHLIDDWQIEAYIDHGKSAAVYRARRGNELAAVKIFDDELIARYGDTTQLARIERELALVGKSYPHLIEILGGGFNEATESHYIVMPYLEGPNLRKVLDEIPSNKIGELVAQLAKAACYLESIQLAHRDIKPENIVISPDFSSLTLLDLGVIRPTTGSTLTDADGILSFVGTLRYSSPEFLLREEEDSEEGWRALTFYQIGGVMHDLIMRKPLFEGYAEPYARLVNAVQRVIPEVQNSAVDGYLIEVARCCLVKDWRMRLRLVSWDSFYPPRKSSSMGQSARQRVTNRANLSRAQLADESASEPAPSHLAGARLVAETIRFLKEASRAIRAANALLPPLTILPNTPNTHGFSIQFLPTKDFLLDYPLTICLSVDALDAPARMVSISACGCLGKLQLHEIEPQLSPIFEGSYDSQSVSNSLEACIYGIIDQAQQIARLEDDSAWISPQVDENPQ